jgi:hypothetical protein
MMKIFLAIATFFISAYAADGDPVSKILSAKGLCTLDPAVSFDANLGSQFNCGPAGTVEFHKACDSTVYKDCVTVGCGSFCVLWG